MSVELSVEVTDQLHLATVRRALADTLRELLAISEPPDINVGMIEDGVESLVRAVDLVLDDRAIWLFGVEWQQYVAALTIVDVEDQSHPTGEKTFAVVSVTGPRTELAHAVVASLAVAIARLAQTDILDDAQAFTFALEISVDRFVEIVRAREGSPDIRTGAKKLYSNLRTSHPS